MFSRTLKKIKLYRKYYPLFSRQKDEWIKQGGKITKLHPILVDYARSAGTAKGSYFHQDVLVAQRIFEHAPRRHMDVGSRVDGFVAHVASYREIEVLDIRPLPPSVHENIKFVQADLMNPLHLGKTDSLSCLHAIEHFGLGRYTDPINVNGHVEGINNLIEMLEEGGILYISFPIGQGDEVHFNAHRVFHPLSIFQYPRVAESLRLIKFDYVDDAGDLFKDCDVQSVVGKLKFGLGIYSFQKI